MQTWITDKDFYKSASNLSRQHLQAQIYEGIHILASLLDVNDKLVNPKRNVKNHPAAKLWVDYEFDLLTYIFYHLNVWYRRGYKSNINEKNYFILQEKIKLHPLSMQLIPKWITDELIETHRSVLRQKEIEKDKKILNKKISVLDRLCEIFKDNYHYHNLWPDTPTNLKMRYDWREIK